MDSDSLQTVKMIKKDSKVKVVFNSIPSKSFQARISEISKYTAQNENTYLVVAKLENSSRLIKTGMRAYFETSINLEAHLKTSNSFYRIHLIVFIKHCIKFSLLAKSNVFI